ncbi:MAG: diphthine--ammonia ligase [Candidatus Bathyarchaeia archaeon]
MKYGVLFSGGKDSTFALHLTAETDDVLCLITLKSKNKESYMFHTPNIEITTLQAEALELPIVSEVTRGQRELELFDLEKAIIKAKEKFGIQGIVTGTVESVYQSSRIQNICNRLSLKCCNPLWKYNQKALLETLIQHNFEVIISGIFAYPLDASWLGRQIDAQIIERLANLQKKFGLNPSGEGGEIETTVLDAPLFRKKIEVLESEIQAKDNTGVYLIKKARLILKQKSPIL